MLQLILMVFVGKPQKPFSIYYFSSITFLLLIQWAQALALPVCFNFHLGYIKNTFFIHNNEKFHGEETTKAFFFSSSISLSSRFLLFNKKTHLHYCFHHQSWCSHHLYISISIWECFLLQFFLHFYVHINTSNGRCDGWFD